MKTDPSLDGFRVSARAAPGTQTRPQEPALLLPLLYPRILSPPPTIRFFLARAAVFMQPAVLSLLYNLHLLAGHLLYSI